MRYKVTISCEVDVDQEDLLESGQLEDYPEGLKQFVFEALYLEQEDTSEFVKLDAGSVLLKECEESS